MSVHFKCTARNVEFGKKRQHMSINVYITASLLSNSFRIFIFSLVKSSDFTGVPFNRKTTRAFPTYSGEIPRGYYGSRHIGSTLQMAAPMEDNVYCLCN